MKTDSDKTPFAFVANRIEGIDRVTANLRDGAGELSAEKLADLFDRPLVEFAAKTLDELRHCERIARLRAWHGYESTQAFRAWLNRPAPIFQGRNPLDLVSSGEAVRVAIVIDRLLLGDFGG